MTEPSRRSAHGSIPGPGSATSRLVRSLGIKNLTFHDLRHDAATMAGVPQRTIMAILGHCDPRMTLRYQHLSPGHLRDAAHALDQRSSMETHGTVAEG